MSQDCLVVDFTGKRNVMVLEKGVLFLLIHLDEVVSDASLASLIPSDSRDEEYADRFDDLLQTRIGDLTGQRSGVIIVLLFEGADTRFPYEVVITKEDGQQDVAQAEYIATQFELIDIALFGDVLIEDGVAYLAESNLY